MKYYKNAEKWLWLQNGASYQKFDEGVTLIGLRFFRKMKSTN